MTDIECVVLSKILNKFFGELFYDVTVNNKNIVVTLYWDKIEQGHVNYSDNFSEILHFLIKGGLITVDEATIIRLET